jgi:hypothetical protein
LSEPIHINPNTPSVNTQLTPPGPVNIGTPVHDQATIVNATATAGGDVHYFVYTNNACTTGQVDLGDFPVVNGSVGQSNAFTPQAAGDFWFQATYSGDVNNSGPVSSACLSEPIHVNPNTVTVSTALSPPGPVDPGTPVSDQATLHNQTADAGGTVHYEVFNNGTCTGPHIADLGTKTVSAGLVPPSDPWTANPPGANVWFLATYSGDANNNNNVPVHSPCDSEPLHVRQPGITIVKRTNGADANDPNGVDVPEIPIGAQVTWTYTVTNTGETHVPRAMVQVTDNQTGVTPTFLSEQSGNGDTIFDPGEVWIYQATGTAIDLTAPPAGVITTTGCTHGGQETSRTAYINLGTATIPGATNNDPSSYCNPVPGISIVKKTNGADANNPNGSDVPEIAPGAQVIWTYIVTNTGNTHVPRAQVQVTDNTTGVTPTFLSEQSGNGDTIFDPGEIWIYQATGTALDLTQPAPPGVTIQPNSCTHGGTETARNAYVNLGTATIPGATSNDPSAYCNPLQHFTANFTPGYWKNHRAATTALLSIVLGAGGGWPGYTVDTFEKAQAILSGMGCGVNGPLQCMAGMLLAADLNLKQGGNTCIQGVIDQANALLAKYHYNGFIVGKYPNVTAADNLLAMKLHDQLSSYNIDGVPTC